MVHTHLDTAIDYAIDGIHETTYIFRTQLGQNGGHFLIDNSDWDSDEEWTDLHGYEVEAGGCLREIVYTPIDEKIYCERSLSEYKRCNVVPLDKDNPDPDIWIV